MRVLVGDGWRITAVAIICFSAAAFASKDYKAPEVKAAQTYPAHEEHANEHLAIAVEPYDSDEKQTIFPVDFRGNNILPVLLVVSNDGDQPIALTDMQIQLITAQRDKLMPASSDDIYRRLAHPQANDRQTVPLPIPRRRKVKGAVSQKTMDEIQSAQFAAKAVEPHTTRSGFLFFDVRGIHNLAGAHVLFTNLHNGQGGDLMFFEIPLDKYFGAAPPRANSY
jgi:hypothetical protein